MKKLIEKAERREKRKLKIRSTVVGTSERPRMSVFRSNKRIYVQIIDDSKGCTITSASNLEDGLKEVKANVTGAEKIGLEIGKRLVEKKIKTVVFDRNGFLYHGVVKAVAEGARKAGITI